MKFVAGLSIVALIMPALSASADGINVHRDTIVPISFNDQLSMSHNKVGDPFSASVVDSNLDLPVGTRLEGHVVDILPKHDKQPAGMDLQFDDMVLPDGSRCAIAAIPVNLKSKGVYKGQDGRLHGDPDQIRPEYLLIGGTLGGLAIGALIAKPFEATFIGAIVGILMAAAASSDQSNSDIVAKRGTKAGALFQEDIQAPYSGNPPARGYSYGDGQYRPRRDSRPSYPNQGDYHRPFGGWAYPYDGHNDPPRPYDRYSPNRGYNQPRNPYDRVAPPVDDGSNQPPRANPNDRYAPPPANGGYVPSPVPPSNGGYVPPSAPPGGGYATPAPPQPNGGYRVREDGSPPPVSDDQYSNRTQVGRDRIDFDGKTLSFPADQQPYRAGRVLMVPLDFMSDRMGLALDDRGDGRIYLESGDNMLRLDQRSKTYLVNGKRLEMPAAMENRAGVIFVPIDILATICARPVYVNGTKLGSNAYL